MCTASKLDEKDLYDKAKLLLEIYRDVCWNTVDYVNDLREEFQEYDGDYCSGDMDDALISLLIEMGFTPVDIAKRVGHENINITMHYAHMFPQKQDEMIDKLEDKNNLLEEEISWTDTKKKKDLMGITESETE